MSLALGFTSKEFLYGKIGTVVKEIDRDIDRQTKISKTLFLLYRAFRHKLESNIIVYIIWEESFILYNKISVFEALGSYTGSFLSKIEMCMVSYLLQLQ